MSQDEQQPLQPTPRDDLYYQALVTGWITTKLERDKSILTLAGGGIGLAVTLMTTIGPSTCSMLWLYGIAIVFFIASLVTIVIVLDRNADHLEAVVSGRPEKDASLSMLDQVSFWAFVAGAVVLAIVGLMTGLNKLNQPKEEESVNTKSSNSSASTPELVKKSLNGVGALRPQQPVASGQPTQQQPSTGSTSNSTASSSGSK